MGCTKYNTARHDIACGLIHIAKLGEIDYISFFSVNSKGDNWKSLDSQLLNRALLR